MRIGQKYKFFSQWPIFEFGSFFDSDFEYLKPSIDMCELCSNDEDDIYDEIL